MDPTEVRGPQSAGTVVFNSSMIVFREGLEAVLIFAAITASFQGANKARRRPVVLGAALSFAAAVATWFVVAAVLDAASPLGPRLEAITGFIAIAVLLVVLNWFVHKVYWTGWIAKHHRQRRKVLGRVGHLGDRRPRRARVHERLPRGLRGRALPAEPQAPAGVVRRARGRGDRPGRHRGRRRARRSRSSSELPYKKMLVATGVLIGVVLVVMIGGTALSFSELGWLPQHRTPFDVPVWMGSWFEIYPYWETLGAQVLAAGFVIGSYYAAQYVRVKRPRREGRQAAVVAEAPPVLAEHAA